MKSQSRWLLDLKWPEGLAGAKGITFKVAGRLVMIVDKWSQLCICAFYKLLREAEDVAQQNIICLTCRKSSVFDPEIH